MLELKYKIRASKASEILGGSIGLSDAQKKKLNELQTRTKPLTENMKVELADLLEKSKNVSLPEGMKTHAKNWIKETLYKRKYFKGNKYTEKGIANEEEGITLLSLYYKCWFDSNTEYVENEYMCGTCDINHAVFGIIDIKNSYDLSTFPMYETELPNKEYGDQVNVYQELYDNKKTGRVAYVLTDLDDEALERKLKWLESDNDKQNEALLYVFGAENWQRVKDKFFPNAEPIEFVEIPNEKRVKVFEVPYDESVIEKIKKRVPEIRKYIKSIV